MCAKSSPFMWILLWMLAACLSVQLVAGAPMESLEARMNEDESVGEIMITYPHQWAKWHTGEIHNVSWHACTVPQDVDLSCGATILLLNADTLDTPLILATGTNVDLSTGRIELTAKIPHVDPSDQYFVGIFVGEPPDNPTCGDDMACGHAFKINLD